MLRVVFLAFTVSLALASKLGNGSSYVQIDTPAFHHMIGPSIEDNTAFGTYPFVTIHTSQACLAGSNFSGSVVYTHDIYELDIPRTSEVANCVLRSGGVALIITTSDLEPGRMFLAKQYYKKEDTSLPVLVASKFDMEIVRDGIGGEPDSIILTCTVNKWKEVFTSDEFFAGYRVVLPLSAFVAALCCARSLRNQLTIRRNLKTGTSNASTRQHAWTNALVLFTISCELFSASTICIYCALGPVFSPGPVPYEAHIIIFVLPVAFSACTSLVAVTLFIRWGSLSTTIRNRLETVCLGGGIMIPLITLGIEISWLTGTIQTSRFINTLGFMGGVTTVVAFLVFLVAGISFTRKLHMAGVEMVTSNMASRKSAMVRRFQYWIFTVTFANFISFSTMGLAVGAPEVFRAPPAFALCWFLFYCAVALQAAAQGFGLNPSSGAMDDIATAAKKRQRHPSIETLEIAPVTIHPAVAVYPIVQSARRQASGAPPSPCSDAVWAPESGMATPAECVV